METARDGDTLVLSLRGWLDVHTAGRRWADATSALDGVAPGRVVVEAAELTYCDTAGVGLLRDLERRARKRGAEFEIRGLSADAQRLCALFPAGSITDPQLSRRVGVVEEVGRLTAETLADLRDQVTFIGHLFLELLGALVRPRRVRWKDAIAVFEDTGAGALPIVVLLGFLMGLIMAFQSAIPLRYFGADVYVADLVAISMIRELGPLLVAIVLAGRTGSAFAAELGAMRVTEEVDALATMGFSPVRFLVLPRVIATVLATPLLVMFANIASLLGGAVVVLSFGYNWQVYRAHVLSSLDVGDLLGGLAKSLAFAFIVAGVGAQRGLSTGAGAAAVGQSTTRAVVTALILIIVADGGFAVLYFALGI